MKFTNPSWAKLPDLPWRMADPSSAILNGQMYVLGGYTAQTGYGMVYGKMYAWDGAQWVQKAAMPVPVWGQASVVYNNKMWVFGGMSATADINTIQKYDPSTDTWEIVGEYPYNLGQGLYATAVGKYAYIRFGNRGNNTDTGIYFTRYDLETHECIVLTTPPSNTTMLVGNWGAIDHYNGYLYEIGGNSPTGGGVGVNYFTKYDIANNTWSEVGTIPVALYGHVRENLIYDDKLWVSNGQRVSGEFFSALHSYDFATSTWETHELAPYAADGVAGGWVNGKFYLLGGRNANVSTSGVADCAVFDPTLEAHKNALNVIAGNQVIKNNLLQRHYPAYGSINTNPPNSQLSVNELLTSNFDKTLAIEALDTTGWAALAFSTSSSSKYSVLSGVSLEVSSGTATIYTLASGTKTQVAQVSVNTSGKIKLTAQRTGSTITFRVNETTIGTVTLSGSIYAHVISKLSATNVFSSYEDTYDLDVILNMPSVGLPLYIGSQQVQKMYIGNQEVVHLYKGSALIF